jgi:hypothetical protein
MKKYYHVNELAEWLAGQRKFAIEEQRKNRCDDQQDAYWQGYIDIIETLADEMEICLDVF